MSDEFQFQRPATINPTNGIPSMAKSTDAQGGVNRAQPGPCQGPPAAALPPSPLADWERKALDRLVGHLQAWREMDHEDAISLSRNAVITLLEGLKRGHLA